MLKLNNPSFVVGFAFFLSISMSSCSQEQPGGESEVLVDPATTTVVGITVGSSEKDILRILGKPVKVEKSFDEPTAESGRSILKQ
jgi:outer membrane protein assembly factor BamE (lipoprotein component of BamABCDE complex)